MEEKKWNAVLTETKVYFIYTIVKEIKNVCKFVFPNFVTDLI